MNKTTRIVIMVHLLFDNTPMSIKLLAVLLNTSSRNIYRDLQLLRSMKIPIARKHNGRFFIPKTHIWSNWLENILELQLTSDKPVVSITSSSDLSDRLTKFAKLSDKLKDRKVGKP